MFVCLCVLVSVGRVVFPYLLPCSLAGRPSLFFSFILLRDSLRAFCVTPAAGKAGGTTSATFLRAAKSQNNTHTRARAHTEQRNGRQRIKIERQNKTKTPKDA